MDLGKEYPNRMKRNTYPGTKKRGNLWSFYLYVDGKKVWHSGYQTQREAGEARIAAVSERNRGTYVRHDQVCVSDYISDVWLPSLNSQKPTTIHQYRQKAKYSVEFLGTKRMQDVRPVDIERMQTALLKQGLSPRTVSMATSVLNMAFKHAKDIGQVVASNPCERVRKPRKPSGSSVPRAMNPSQVASILSASEGTIWAGFVRLAFYTGARRGELIALRWGDIDFERATMVIGSNLVQVGGKVVEQSPKGGRARVVTLDEGTVSVLKVQRRRQVAQRLELGPYWKGDGEEWVTIRDDGSSVTPNAAGTAWVRLSRKAGVSGFRLHDSRHTHATHLLAAGVPLHVVAARLGHHDPMVTASTYAHVLDLQAVDASEAFVRAMQA